MSNTDIEAEYAEAERALIALEERILNGDTSVTIHEIETARQRLSDLATDWAATPVQIGSKARDAAVDPRPEDQLPPSNAGDADPHGPAVKAYEVGSPERNAFIAQDRIDHPEKYAGIVPKDDPGAGSVVDAAYLADLAKND